MKNPLYLLYLSVVFLTFLNCSKDEAKKPVIGEWKLIAWTVDIPLDLNKDTAFNLNLLDETACNVNETLNFDSNGIVTSEDTFNPEIIIRLEEGTSDVYKVEETCAEGSIGFSASYDQINNLSVGFNGAEGVIAGEKLTVVYEDAIDIYNEAQTEVIDTKDLTLVYLKSE